MNSKKIIFLLVLIILSVFISSAVSAQDLNATDEVEISDDNQLKLVKRMQCQQHIKYPEIHLRIFKKSSTMPKAETQYPFLESISERDPRLKSARN